MFLWKLYVWVQKTGFPVNYETQLIHKVQLSEFSPSPQNCRHGKHSYPSVNQQCGQNTYCIYCSTLFMTKDCILCSSQPCRCYDYLHFINEERQWANQRPYRQYHGWFLKLGLSDFPRPHLTNHNGMTPQTPLEKIKISGDFLRPWDPAQGGMDVSEKLGRVQLSVFTTDDLSWDRQSRATKGTALLTEYIWVTNSHHVARVNLCPPAIPALPLSSKPSLSPQLYPSWSRAEWATLSFLSPCTDGEWTDVFVSDCTMPFVWGQLWDGAGGGSRMRPTQPPFSRAGNRQSLPHSRRLSSGCRGLGSWATLEEERSLLCWALHRGFTVKCLCCQ